MTARPSSLQGSGRTQLYGALALTAALRLPGLFWPAISDDEAIYDTMARAINAGGVMYRDVVDHKPPGLVYTYALAERLGGISAVHLLGMAAAVLTAWGVYLVARRLMRPPSDAWIAALLYGVASASKCAYDGLAVNGELLMNVPSVFAIACAQGAARRRGPARLGLDVAAGALVALAGLYKWQALVVAAALPLFLERGRGALGRLAAWALGAALPCGLTAAYFWRQGALDAAFFWGASYNLRYVAEGPPWHFALARLAWQLLGVVLPAGVLYVSASVSMWRDRRAQPLWLAVWTLLAVLCLGLGRRFFGHYFLQAELPLAIAAAPVAMAAWRQRPRLLAAALLTPALLFFLLALSPRLTRALFDAGDPDWSSVGAQIAAQTDAADAIFVWGNAPLLYHFAARPAGSRFVFCNYLTGLSPGTPSEYDPGAPPGDGLRSAWPWLLRDLEAHRTPWIVDTAAAGWKGYGKYPLQRYPVLAEYVSGHYIAVGNIAGATLYRRVDGA